jgi:hypothetical protein
MDGLDDRVRLRRQEAVNEVRAGDWLRLRATVALELGPDARERKQLPALIESAAVTVGEPRSVAGMVLTRCAIAWRRDASLVPSASTIGSAKRRDQDTTQLRIWEIKPTPPDSFRHKKAPDDAGAFELIRLNQKINTSR